jgi:mannose-6-phosphate isomerase-like protein (cupin superfamily)
MVYLQILAFTVVIDILYLIPLKIMKLFSLEESPYEPVSHDPKLKKRVLTRDIHPHIKHISHIILQPGDNASEHIHTDTFEVFYCIRGNAKFLIKGEHISIKKGNLLFVEPGEVHSIPEIKEETELLYFHISS